MTELHNWLSRDKGVCRTALATPGLLTRWGATLVTNFSCDNSSVFAKSNYCQPFNFSLLYLLKCISFSFIASTIQAWQYFKNSELINGQYSFYNNPDFTGLFLITWSFIVLWWIVTSKKLSTCRPGLQTSSCPPPCRRWPWPRRRRSGRRPGRGSPGSPACPCWRQGAGSGGQWQVVV